MKQKIFFFNLAWIIENLRNGSHSEVQHVMQRLRNVPIAPPVDCLKRIGILATHIESQMRAEAGLFPLKRFSAFGI